MLLEDEAGEQSVRVLLGYKRLLGGPLRVDLVIEIDDVASDRLRTVALAAGMIAEERVIEYVSA